tara:strand:- start:26 stop:604 length:579 start_codon:yes stop_codon:yes gene_type:complete
MIVKKHKLIFVHPPKCAGESICIALTGTNNNRKGGDGMEGKRGKHWGVNDYSSKYPYLFKTYCSFTVVRNPWDRVISWVKYHDKRRNRTQGTFKHRLKHDLKSWGWMKRNTYEKLLCMNGRMCVDKVLRFENLNEDFKKMCRELNITSSPLPIINSTSHDHYSAYYDKDTQELVKSLFSWDINFFKYKFEND